MWGNPVYEWERLTRQGFAWWVQKFKRLMQLVDVIRVDHFRGFAAYWQVPQGETTAIKGEWVPGPGAELFRVLRQELGSLPVWAEDLGLISHDVEELRDGLAFPGMKVLQFAFDGLGPKNIHLPFHYPHNSVVYTGTHDNDTTLGWWHQLSPGDRHRVRAYLGKHDDHEIHWALIRLALSTVSHTAVFPLQDILGLGGEARMNRPGSPTGNWAWRYRADELQGWMADRLRELTEMYGRAQPRE